MSQENCTTDKREMTSIFERYLTVWVGLCIAGGILLGKIAPDFAKTLDGMSITQLSELIFLKRIKYNTLK